MPAGLGLVGRGTGSEGVKVCGPRARLRVYLHAGWLVVARGPLESQAVALCNRFIDIFCASFAPLHKPRQRWVFGFLLQPPLWFSVCCFPCVPSLLITVTPRENVFLGRGFADLRPSFVAPEYTQLIKDSAAKSAAWDCLCLHG